MLNMIGVASGMAAASSGCSQGPLRLARSVQVEQQLQMAGVVWDWVAMLKPDPSCENTLACVTEINTRLAKVVKNLVETQRFFVTVGGDHACAVGTWSGAAAALQSKGEMGLVWIDAHLDSHTPQTTSSGHIHGMPVASLLGHGAFSLTHLMGDAPKIKPENLCFIGVRSFEPEEKAFIERLKVKVYDMTEVARRGMKAILAEAIERVTQHTVGWGVSIDIDAIDPQDAPGTGIAVPGGIAGNALCDALALLQDQPKLVGVEIAEFDPTQDQDKKTEKLIGALLLCLRKHDKPLT